MADAASGTYGTLRLVASKVGEDAAGRWSDVSWAMYHIEGGGPNLSFNGDGVPASVVVAGVGTVFSGVFYFDWRPAGNQSTLIAYATTRVYHNADGTPPSSFAVSGSIGDTGSNGAGRGASVSEPVALATLKVVPGTPTSVAGVRVDDTSINLTWAQTSASNGAPTSNTIRRKINGGAFGDVVTISPATSATIAAAGNQKIVYGVKGSNAAGDSGWSADSTPVYTTPAAPSGVTATKTGSDIVIALTSNVAFSEHEHVIEHGVDVVGVVTWDGSALTALASGTLSYTHVAPNPAQRHVYRARARNTDAAALSSSTVLSNVVQLLTAPAKPTIPSPPAFADKAATFRFAWTHNAIDSSAQTKRQVRYSTDGGSTWTLGAKTTSTDQFADFAGSTWTANQAVTFQVRTKGAYDSGSDGDASYSPWSDAITVTFKTKPVATITTPVNSSTYTQASLTVVLGFSQAESATFVNSTVGLYQGATLLEEIVTTVLAGTTFATRLADGGSYSVKAQHRDSNGVLSSIVTSSFTVDYTEPKAATVTCTYLPDSGIGQLDFTIGGTGATAVSVTITREIDGVVETVLPVHPASSPMTILDLIPTIHGDNEYTVTTISADGARTDTVVVMTTAEDHWAFLSTGDGFTTIVSFGDNLRLASAPERDAALVRASGRPRPIGLYGSSGNLVVSGTASITTGYASTYEDIEEFILNAKKTCFRDPSGRRVFGQFRGSLTRDNAAVGAVSFSITETS